MKRLDEAPDLECIFGLVDHFQEDDTSGQFTVNVAAAAVGPVAGTMLIRRESFERVGLFATDRRLGEFIDWWARARDAGLRYEILPQVALRRRVHGANMTITQSANHSDYLHVLKAALDRRRAAQ
jgi:GT2 family glycosyltransferase